MTRSKYGNVPTTADGFTFDSLAESRRYGQLKLLQAAGEIRDLRVHPRFAMVVNGVKVCVYVADFGYLEGLGGDPVIEDVKGKTAPLTDVFRLKAKLMKACHGIDVKVVRM